VRVVDGRSLGVPDDAGGEGDGLISWWPQAETWRCFATHVTDQPSLEEEQCVLLAAL
jgi:hypothetical protein